MPLDEKVLKCFENIAPTLTTLELRKKQLETKYIKVLASALEHNQTLTLLNLGIVNSLGVEGAKLLAPVLERNQTLTSLYLGCNDLGAEGTKALAPALERNQTLTLLDLRNNSLGVEGAKALALALERNQTLTSLNLSANKFGAEGAKALASALERNQTLTSLDLSANKLGTEGTKALAAALERNQTLVSLGLGGEDLGTEGAKVLASALERNQKLFEELLVAVKEGEEKVLTSLLERGVSVLRYSKAGYTPLMEAVLAGQLSSVKILLPYYHTVTARSQAEEKAHEGKTALELAHMLAEEKAEAPKDLLEHKGEVKLDKSKAKIPANVRLAIVNFLSTYQKLIPLYKNPVGKIVFAKKIMAGHLDLSNQYLDDKAHLETIVKVFQNNDAMTTLILSGCRLFDAECKILAPLLSKASRLTELNLSNNRLTHLGCNYLAKTLSGNSSLRKLNLQGNFIYIEKPLFNVWHRKLKKASGLEVVDVSQNFLRKKCNALFQSVKDQKGEHKEEHKGEPKKTRVFHYAQIFCSRTVPVTSLIKVEYQITPTSWLVCLTCPKDKEHAMLYLEGMRASGQRFLECYHITARGMWGIADVEIESITPQFFKPENYYFMEHEIDSTQGETLSGYIRADKTKRINFSKYYPSSSSDKVNCLGWAIKKLALIGIQVDRGVFGLPSRAAGGGGCLTM